MPSDDIALPLCLPSAPIMPCLAHHLRSLCLILQPVIDGATAFNVASEIAKAAPAAAITCGSLSLLLGCRLPSLMGMTHQAHVGMTHMAHNEIAHHGSMPLSHGLHYPTITCSHVLSLPSLYTNLHNVSFWSMHYLGFPLPDDPSIPAPCCPLCLNRGKTGRGCFSRPLHVLSSTVHCLASPPSQHRVGSAYLSKAHY